MTIIPTILINSPDRSIRKKCVDTQKDSHDDKDDAHEFWEKGFIWLFYHCFCGGDKVPKYYYILNQKNVQR